MRPAAILLPLTMLTACYQSETADLVVHNATIHTLDENGTTHQAMAVRNGRIVELGPERQVLNKYRAKEMYDAQGRPVYPGFIDGHCHFFGYGLNKQKVDLSGTTSWEAVLQRVQAHAQAHPGTGWILGRGWDENLWPGGSMPDNERLNALFPDRPVLLQRVDGHAAVVNEAAMRAVGFDPDAQVEGGLMVRRNGRPTGLLVDNAVAVFQPIIDQADEDTKRKALLQAQADCFDAGLTMVVDAGLDTGTIALIRRMQEEGALKMRVYAMVSESPENRAHFTGRGPIVTDRLFVRSLKVYSDGALGSRGAWLKDDYHDHPGHRGLQLVGRERLLEVAHWCKANGFQLNTHAIGDAANRLVLEVYGEVLGGTNDLRWRIEHAQVVSPEDRALFAAHSIIPSVQPTHATSDGPWAEQRLGPHRMEGAYAFGSLRKTVGLVALGTDFPVEPIDPLQTFRSAVLRQNPDGWPDGGFRPQEALSRSDALRGMTIWNAIATFTENDLGTLEPGKFADFVVLDRDLLKVDAEGLRKAKVLATYVNGERMK